MSGPEPCPCGRPKAYADCCGPLHRGERRAATAEDLMRSRYAAYARGQVPYLVATLHPDQRAALDRKGLQRSATKTRWIGLEIRATDGGSMLEQVGTVEFVARYEEGGRAGALHERSRFVRHDGAWMYVDGVFPGG